MTEGYSRIRSVRVADHFAKQRDGKSQFNVHFLNANTDPIAAGVLNTQYMARSDLNWTDFIYVPKGDLNAFKNFKKRVVKVMKMVVFQLVMILIYSKAHTAMEDIHQTVIYHHVQ